MIREGLRFLVVLLACFALVPVLIYAQYATTPVPFMDETIRQAQGRSVLVKTEKIGDDIKPLIVRHYARYTEIGTIEFWEEVIR